MEDTRYSSELVHVLRHSFEPSEPLKGALEAFAQTGSERPRFLFKSMAGLAIQSQHRLYPPIVGGVFKARQEYERHNLNLHITDQLAVGRLGSGALRVFVGLTDESREILKATQHTLKKAVSEEGYDPYSEWVIDPPGGPYHLYTELSPKQALSSRSDIHEGGIAIRKAIQQAQGTNKFIVTSQSILENNEPHILISGMYYEDKAS